MMTPLRRSAVARLAVASRILALSLLSTVALGEEWPMLGRDGTRNAVSRERGAPINWNVDEYDRGGKRLLRVRRGVRWSAALGNATFSSPVISSGLVWIGTNSGTATLGYPDHLNGILRCFRVANGKLVYEYKSPAFGDRMIRDTTWGGIGSSPLVEGDRLWLATNRGEVFCLDIGPLIRGEGAPRELWRIDMVSQFGIYHRMTLMGPPRPCSIGPSWNGRIFVTTSNGAGRVLTDVPQPDAPNLLCLDKETGKVLWQDKSPGANILTTQFASPTVATIGSRVQVIVPQSDGWVRSFNPETGENLWEFDMNFKTSTYESGGRGTRNDLLANAIVYEDRVYVASGQEAEHGEGPGRLVCIDPTKRGDISSELAVDSDGNPLPRRRIQAVMPENGERTIPNPNSGLVWEFVSTGKKHEEQMHRTMSSVVISNGLLFAVDFGGFLHCLDASTGKKHWTHDLLASVWGSPLIVGDKAYVGDEDGVIHVFQVGADPTCAEPVATITHEDGVYSTPAYADSVLYVASRTTLHAIDADLASAQGEHVAFWPQWRGPNRDNRSLDTNLLTSWPENGPALVWRVDGLGDGIASLAIAERRIFTSTTYDRNEFIVAVDADTGQRLWAQGVGTALPEHPLMRWLGQRTPSVDRDRVYAFTNAGWLHCLATSGGAERWKVNYPSEFGTRPGRWGFCDRPLVDGDKLICVPGGSIATVVALNKYDGTVVWKTLLESKEQASYGSTIVVDTQGLRQYVVVLEKGIASFAANDGRFLWRYDAVANVFGTTYTPLILRDGLLCQSGYGGNVARVKLTRQRDHVAAEQVYLTKLQLDPFEDSTVLVDDRLYAFAPLPFCFSLGDGSKIWGPVRPAGGGYKTAATYADGHLYTRGTNGLVTLMEASAKEYVEKGRFVLPEARSSAGATFPVVTGGRLFVRDNDRLHCFDVARLPEGASRPPAALVKWDDPGPPSVPRVFSPAGPLPLGRVADAIFVPTPRDVVERMLTAARVTKDDVVYDLGSGDGRIVIEAAKKYGCRGVGIEIERDLIELSRERARQAGVSELVTFRQEDLFTADFQEATVVTAYLFPALLTRLTPTLEQLKPGTRIVTHQFLIPDAPSDEKFAMQSAETGDTHAVYLWRVPFRK
jgi:outer membrane protein assembly factor BamB